MARKKQTAPNKPFDATTKTLVEANPKDWLDFLGLPATEYELISADLSTVTTDADRLIRVSKPIEYAVHQEFQAGAELRFPDRCLRYNVLAEDRLQIPVETVAILLRPEADAYKNITGRLERRDIQGKVKLSFEYHVVRLWQVPVEEILKGGLAMLPLALLTDLAGMEPETVVRRMESRLAMGTLPEESRRFLWTSAYILAGLTYKSEEIERLFGGVLQMKESVTYQKIIAEGRAEGIAQGVITGRVQEAQNMLLLFGEGRLGKPDAEITRYVREIKSVERLEEMAKRLLTVESWSELLGQ